MVFVGRRPFSCRLSDDVLSSCPIYAIQPVLKPVVKPGLTTGLTTALNEQPVFVQPVVKLGCTIGLTTGCIRDTAICQPVECLYTRYNRLSSWFDNRLYRVNGASVLRVCNATVAQELNLNN